LSLSEHQSAFNQYWQDKNVVNGYYTENGVQKKAYGWKQYKRWENYWKTRVNIADNTFPNYSQYKLADLQFEENLLQERSSSGQWISLGPSSSNGGYAGVGRLNCIEFHPTDNDVFWVGAPTGGLWKTDDGGITWNTLTDDNEVLGVSTIAIPSDYQTSQTIYIGTGDKNSWHHDNGNGIFKSTDGGITWDVSLEINVASNITVNKILIHPSNNNILYAAATNGIFKTVDAGLSWNQIYSNNYISDLEFHPSDPSILYASNKWYGEIYKVTNDGSNVYTVFNDGEARRIELAVTPASPNMVYAVVVNSEHGLRGIYKSYDSGESFNLVTQTPNILANDVDGTSTGGQGWYDLALVADPYDEDILYCGGVNTWKSYDGGVSWEINNFWTSYYCSSCEIVHADKHFFAYNGTSLYECNDGGLYKTEDGTNWDNISNGIVNSQMYKLSTAQTSDNITIAGLQDNGTKLRHYDNNWYDVVGGDGMNCEIDPTNENYMYASIQNGKLVRTVDGWSGSYELITRDSDGNPINGLDETGEWVTPYLISHTEPSTLYIGLDNVWKSVDRGDSWTKISDIYATDKLDIIAMSESNSQVIYTAEVEAFLQVANLKTYKLRQNHTI
jgi:photosystem II stability/assembly factor-like uncharacterized protein